MLKLFLGIFRRDKRFFRNILTVFLTQVLTQTVADRPGRSTVRSTEPRAGRPLRSTDVHSLVHVWQTQGRSAGRPTGPESFALCIWAVDRAVDWTREPAHCIWAVDRAVDRTREPCSLYLGGRPGLPNGHIFDRWRSTGPVDRQPVRLPDQPNG